MRGERGSVVQQVAEESLPGDLDQEVCTNGNRRMLYGSEVEHERLFA